MRLIRFIMGTIGTIIGTMGVLILLFFSCWFLAASCSRAHVFVTNESGTTISNLVISGSCKERHTDALAPLSEWRTVTPYDRGGLIHFSFVSGGTSYTAIPDRGTNLSGFCGMFFTVGSNMAVKSHVVK